MRVLIAKTNRQLAEERARQLQMDGHHISVALTGHATALKDVWGWVGPVLAGVVAVPVITVVGRRYDAAVRADVRGAHEGPAAFNPDRARAQPAAAVRDAGGRRRG